MAYASKEDQTCFHCGFKSHAIDACPSLLRGEEQSSKGKAAQLAFYDARKKWRKEHGKNKKPKSNIHHYLAMKEYLCSLSSTIKPGECKFRDPVKILKRYPQENSSPNKLQKAAREFFNCIHAPLLQKIILSFENIDDSVDYNDIVRTYRHKNENNPWVHTLNNAVRKGCPADFSDVAKNRYYTIQKSETRTRYLYLLIMDDNSICKEIRDVLIGLLNKPDGGKIRVCTLGGGPGYDHVAIWVALLFIYNMNESIANKKITVNTDVYDLYGEWEDIVITMDQSLDHTLKAISEADNGKDHFKTCIFKGEGASTKLCDIREDLDSPVNSALSESLLEADIIFFSFVIHENASIIISKDEDDPLIQGAARDIMERSRIGTVMICTDSNNTCWPAFRLSAKFFGWEFFGSLERGSRISLGPKEWLLCRRVEIPSTSPK